MRQYISFFCLAFFLCPKLNAQAINMQQLRVLASPTAKVPRQAQRILNFAPIYIAPNPTGSSRIFLPVWRPSDLPVFCRIEHEIGRQLPVMVKFRLGSVEYVDWLEGK